MNNLTFLIKPSSSACNLDCKYCFYKDISKNRDVYTNDFMDISTLENIVKNAVKVIFCKILTYKSNINL